ncbi:DUF748 domain-containing protein [Pandoraea fibrosis]|uniref:DUF748 domain-containing protein n=1 Tax=Pandoraea fibrosis TaxID=1891094 RepID=A0ABX6HUH5_9BURK|nr:DUF748 domain-containing protein [Pandoraea fibrosis]QHE91902.1 DUF748 domain-containing protein [Pandoraea fibrosis]QHF14541.1 DUF748 domain-containing protein [Pandoraea fibrosis]
MAEQANDRKPSSNTTSGGTRLQQGVARAQALGRDPDVRRRARKTGLWAAGVIAVFGVVSYFTVPAVLKHYAVDKLSAYLERPVSVGGVSFNPYTLRLDLRQVHIGDKTPGQPFVDVGMLRVNASWGSVFRFAPIVDELYIDTPVVNIVRTAPQRFNFSDIIDRATSGPPSPEPSKPARFALNNVQIKNGTIRVDDTVQNEKHVVDNLQVGVPFIANLPADTDIFVQPLLQASIDGSPLHISGQTKPFADSMESTVDIKLDHLDVPKYLGYSPLTVPAQIKSASISTDLKLRFTRDKEGNHVLLTGTAGLSDAKVVESDGSPIVAVKQVDVKLAKVEPLNNVIHIDSVRIDGLDQQVTLRKDGSLNVEKALLPQRTVIKAVGKAVDQAAASPQAHEAARSAPQVPAQQTARPATPASAAEAAQVKTQAAAQPTPLDLLIGDVSLVNSKVRFTDERGAKPASVALENVQIGVKQFSTLGKEPATYDASLGIQSGGSVKAHGQFSLNAYNASGELDAQSIALAPLLPLAQGALAGDLKSGTVGAQAKFNAAFSPDKQPNVQISPATATLEKIEWLTGQKGDAPLKLAKAEAKLSRFDLGARQAVVDEVTVTGLDVSARRDKDGKINLLALTGNGQPKAATSNAQSIQSRVGTERGRRTSAKASGPQASAGDWQWKVGKVAIENASIGFEDRDVKGRPINAKFAPLNVKVQGASQDMSKPLQLEVNGTLNKKGSLNASGNITPQPLAGDLQIKTQQLDLAAFDSYMSDQLNASIASALLSSNGRATFAMKGDTPQATYRGDATLGNVRLLDKVTADDFMRWNALSVQQINLAVGSGKPNVQMGSIALSRFYARLIINANGRLNLADVVGNKETAPRSLTRANEGVPLGGAAEKPPLDAAASAVEAGQPTEVEKKEQKPGETTAQRGPGYGAGKALPADVHIGRITLQGGNINFTDNFVKPNYTANLTDIGGRIGAFGTATTEPAEVALQGKVNRNAPIGITGKINPLAPMAFVDIGAKADGIELTNLTPYSTKYAGYPIEKGKLTVDVHYLLDQAKLTANNHIFIDQLTFGDRVESPTATNLPVRLAVSLLKNSRGEIDVDIPISGSLDDPQFSLGGVIFRAFVNLIVKAVTAPFSLLASAFGGGDQELGYVEFAPGSARLTPESEKRLETLVKALTDREALKLDIEGRVDPAKDTDGLRSVAVERAIKAQKVKSMVGKGESIDVDSVTVSPEERSKYLTAAYKAADFAKPRNMIGFAKSLPDDEMEKLLETNVKVNDDDLRALAERRAQRVRSWLDGKIASDRLFVVAPKLNADGIKDKGATTRVDFALK